MCQIRMAPLSGQRCSAALLSAGSRAIVTHRAYTRVHFVPQGQCREVLPRIPAICIVCPIRHAASR